MSEKQRLISDEIAEERESNGSDSPPATGSDEKSSLTSKIRRRQSPPHNSGNYGTISDIKYQPLIGPGASGSGSSKSHFTRKQTVIAVIAFLLFAAGVAVTLILGLPRLEAKRREYFEAKFFESPLTSVAYGSKAYLLNSAPECSKIARDEGTVIDSAISAVLCSLIASPHLIRPDSRIYGIYIQNGTFHEISTSFDSVQLRDKRLGSPAIFDALRQIHQRFDSKKNFTDLLEGASKLAQTGVPMSNGLAEVINQNLEKKSKWKSDFLQVTTSVDGTVRPGQTVKNPGFSQFLLSFNESNIQDLLIRDLAATFDQEINMTEPEVRFGKPLITDFMKFSVLSLNNGPGRVMDRFLRIQATLNDKFDECNDQARTLKDGTKEFHYLIESLKHSLQALTSAEPDNQQNILDRSRQITDIPENNASPMEAKTYGYDSESLKTIKGIQKSSLKRSFQLLIHDSASGDSIVLVGQNRRNLFEGDKFASKTMGFALDMFANDDKKEYLANPEANPTIVLDPVTKSIKYLLTSEYDSCAGVAQVLSKLTLSCESLKTAIDESRIFYIPKKNQVLVEDKFPRAYIDLLMKLYGHMNMDITPSAEKLSSVYAIESRKPPATASTLDLLFRKLSVFFDWRSGGEGFLNGV